MKNGDSDTLSIIIPVLDEAENLSTLLQRLHQVLDGVMDHEIIVVDDGSRDQTLEFLRARIKHDSSLRYFSLTRNFGHQTALRVGLDHASGAAIVSLDADLQHPPELIPELIEQWRNGYPVVNAIRVDDAGGLFKRYSSRLFYRLVNAISDIRIEPGSSDFRLLDRKVVDCIKALPERGVFLRGIIPWLGFRQCNVNYQPAHRLSGKSKFSLIRMIRLGITGITSSSFKPLQLSTAMGLIMSFVSLVYAVYALCVKVFVGTAIPGWTSVLIMVIMMGGVQLIMLGIIGEYLGRVSFEVKGRPDYIVQESTDEESAGTLPQRQGRKGQFAGDKAA